MNIIVVYINQWEWSITVGAWVTRKYGNMCLNCSQISANTGQGHREFCADLWLALGDNAAAVGAGDGGGDGQTQAGSGASRCIRAVQTAMPAIERIEDVIEFFGRDAIAIINNAHNGPFAALAQMKRHGRIGSLAPMLERVVEQNKEQLLDAIFIGAYS